MRTASQDGLPGGPTHLAHQAPVSSATIGGKDIVAVSGGVRPPGWLVACEQARRNGDDVNALAERIASSQGASLIHRWTQLAKLVLSPEK